MNVEMDVETDVEKDEEMDVDMDVGMGVIKKIIHDQPSTSIEEDTNGASEMGYLKEVVDKLEISGGGLKQNLHGSEFQLGILMLVLWRAYSQKYPNFRLATELEEAEKFDDIVIMSRKNETDKWALRLIQAKHKEGETIRKIDRANLMAEDDSGFALQKYFHSFIKIQRRCIHKSFYSAFSKAEIKDVLLVTNTDLKDEELKNSFDVEDKEIDIRNDKLLGVNSKPNTVTYKISQKESDPLRQDLKQILERSSDFYILILTIAKSIIKNKPLNNTITVIKEFIQPLRRDVFNCEKEKGKNVLKFSQAFFDTTNFHPELDKFRDALLEEVAFSRSCWKFEVRNTFGGSSTSLSDELLQKLAKLLDQKIKDNSELQIQDCLGAHQILLEQVINKETGKFYSKFIENKGNKMVKLRDFLKKETGMAYSELASVQIKISSELSEYNLSADKDVLHKIADAFASQLRTQGGNTASLEERLSADLIAYENVLAKKVLDVDKGELLDSFKSGNIENDPNFDIKEFRRILMEKIVSPDKKQEAECFLKKTKIDVSDKLANDMQFDGNLTITNPVEFAKQFHQILEFSISSKSPHSNSNVDVSIAETTFKLALDAKENWKIFSQNICVLGMSNVFVKKFKKTRLSTNFFESTELLGNLAEFRENLIDSFGKDKFNMFFKFEFDIGIKGFKCEREECAFPTLPQPFDENQFNEFIKKFRLVVNYPNRHELMNTIQREIEERFCILNSSMPKAAFYEKLKTWMSQRICTFYSAQEATKLFKEIEKGLRDWTLNGVSEAYFSNTPKKYSFQTMKSLFRSFLSNERCQILNLVFDEIALGRIRTVDTFLELQRDNIESFQKYTRKLGHIFITLDQLKDFKFYESFALSLEDCQLWNLLVIECDLQTPCSTLYPLNMLAGLNVSERKIIFVAKFPNELLRSQFLSISSTILRQQKNYTCTLSEETMETQFSDLTDKSQQVVSRQAKINFQECTRSFGDLLDDCSKQLVDASVLANIIAEVPIKVGNGLVLSEGYNESFYIERAIDRSVEIKEDVLQNFDDIIVLSEFEQDFIEAREKHAGDHAKNIHWLRKKSKKLFWMETYGSIAKLVELRVNKIDSNAERNKASDFGKNLLEHELFETAKHQKLMIISNTAGMGKTTILSNIPKLLKRKYSNLWILRVDLNHYKDFFDQELKSRKDKLAERPTNDVSTATDRAYQMKSGIDFLIRLLKSSEQYKLTTDFEWNLLKDSLLRKSKLQVALLLDGFDEISPTYMDIVLDLVQALQLTYLQLLIITTRPCTQKTLEERLGTFACRMKEFSRSEQSQFLTNFWRSRLSAEMNWSDACEYHLTVYVDKIMSKYSESLNDSHMQFTGIPLQLRLLAEVFEENLDGSQWDGCKKFVMSTQEMPQLPNRLNVFELFGKFVEKKFEIFRREKRFQPKRSEDDPEWTDFFKTFVEQHEKMALFLIFEEDDLRPLFENFGGFQENMEEIRSYIARIEEGQEKRGIVTQVIDGKPHFIHRSFAEYFAAHYLGKGLLRTSPQHPLHEFLLTKVLGSRHMNEGIEYFFNAWLAKRSRDIPTETKYELGKYALNLGVARDGHGGAIRSIAVPCFGKYSEIIGLFCECLQMYFDREGDQQALSDILNFNNEALNFAFMSNASGDDYDMKTMKILAQYGANLIPFISSESHLMFDYPAVWFQMWRCFLLHAEEGGRKEKGLDVASLLSHIWPTFDFAIYLEDLEFGEFLIERGLRLDNTDYQGKLPLHTAARTGNVELVRWLICNRVDLSLCDDFGRNALHCACLAGHLEIAKVLVEDLTTGGAGLDINFNAKFGMTILHTAVSSHNTDILQWILDQGIDINSPNNLGCTPLHIAARENNQDTVSWLVSKGANINAIAMDCGGDGDGVRTHPKRVFS